MTTSTIYRPAVTNHLNHLKNINAAYKLAGVKIPTRGPAFQSMLNTIGEPETVIRQQIRHGLDTVSTDKQLKDWYAETIGKVSEAIAAERLRKEFTNQSQHVQKSLGTSYATQAVEDLEKPFAEFIAKFSKHAEKLPEGKHALDPEACLAIDAGSHLKRVREALAQLGTYAGLIITKVSLGNTPHQMANLAKIVHFPKATQEVVEGVGRGVRNPSQLEHTYAIRQVDNDLQKQGIDLTLIDIARGKYAGVTFQLADNAEHAARVENLHTAFTRKIHDESPSTLARLQKAAHQTITFTPGI